MSYTGLVERLRATKFEADGPDGIWEVLRNPDGPEAADAIEALTRPVDVEAVARALCLQIGRMGDTEAVERNRVEADWPRYVGLAQAALAAMETPHADT